MFKDIHCTDKFRRDEIKQTFRITLGFTQNHSTPTTGWPVTRFVNEHKWLPLVTGRVRSPCLEQSHESHPADPGSSLEVDVWEYPSLVRAGWVAGVPGPHPRRRDKYDSIPHLCEEAESKLTRFHGRDRTGL